MSALLKALAWCRDHMEVVIGAILAILGFVLGGVFVADLRRPDKQIKKSLDVLDAGKKASQDAVQRGSDVAVQALTEQHATTIAQLDDTQKAKAEALKQDPKALARYLTDLTN